MSMYNHVKSKIKVNNNVCIGFECNIGVRLDECLTPFLFAMYVNDIQNEFQLKGIDV